MNTKATGVERDLIDDLVRAVDDYIAISVARQRHMKGRWEKLLKAYCVVTGMKPSAANRHLSDNVLVQ